MADTVEQLAEVLLWECDPAEKLTALEELGRKMLAVHADTLDDLRVANELLDHYRGSHLQ